MATVDERRDALRHRGVELFEGLVNAGRRIEDDALGPHFVLRRAGQDVLEEVREGAVADVVEHRGGERVAGAVGRELLPVRELAVDGAEARHQELHDEGGAERVGEAGVLGAGERERRHAELSNSAEALHLGGVDEALDDALFVGFERDESMDGIAEDHDVAASGEIAALAVAALTEPSSA